MASDESCRTVVQNKQLVGIPDSCAFDFCETWKGSGSFGNGEYTAGINLVDCTDLFGAPADNFFCMVSDNFVAKDGDEIFALNLVSISGDSGIAAGVHYVTGGTGRFAGVEGKLFIRVDNNTGRATVNGEICGHGNNGS